MCLSPRHNVDVRLHPRKIGTVPRASDNCLLATGPAWSQIQTSPPISFPDFFLVYPLALPIVSPIAISESIEYSKSIETGNLNG